MRELKRLFVLVLALTFLAGVGTGAWVGTLAAGPAVEPPSDDGGRVSEFQRRFGLDATQTRQLRVVLGEHDQRIRRIRDDVTAEQFRRKLAEEEISRDRIRQILTPKQREEYDKLLGRS